MAGGPEPENTADERIAMTGLRKGSRVRWKSHGGEAEGKVVRKLVAPTDIKGHHVAASADKPQWLVETDDGKQAAHHEDALTRVAD